MPDDKELTVITDIENPPTTTHIDTNRSYIDTNRSHIDTNKSNESIIIAPIQVPKADSETKMPTCCRDFLNRECWNMLVMSFISMSVVCVSLIQLVRTESHIDETNIYTTLIALILGIYTPQPRFRS